MQPRMQGKHVIAENIGNNGKRELDEALYCWALQQLNPAINLTKAQLCFQELADCYEDKQRYFHSLGHPRSLLPEVSINLYATFISSVEELQVNFSDFLNSQMEILLPRKEERIHEALIILSLYYHDIVHRVGKKPQLLDKYLVDDSYHIDATQVPYAASMATSQSTSRPEELSCIAVEENLRLLEINPKHLISILLAIMATIPFQNFHHPDDLRKRLLKTLDLTGIDFSEDEINQSIDIALEVSERDLSSFAHLTLKKFNEFTWAIICLLYTSPSPRD